MRPSPNWKYTLKFDILGGYLELVINIMHTQHCAVQLAIFHFGKPNLNNFGQIGLFGYWTTRDSNIISCNCLIWGILPKCQIWGLFFLFGMCARTRFTFYCFFCIVIGWFAEVYRFADFLILLKNLELWKLEWKNIWGS